MTLTASWERNVQGLLARDVADVNARAAKLGLGFGIR